MKRNKFVVLILLLLAVTLLLGCEAIGTRPPSPSPSPSPSPCDHFSGNLSGYPERYRGQALLVVQTETEIVVENISGKPLAIRISWNHLDPNGTGEGEDSCITGRVPHGSRISHKIKSHESVQIWSWDEHTNLIEEVDLLLSEATSQSMNPSPTPTVSPIGHEEDKELYRGSILLVIRTNSEIIVENISGSLMAIRISFDECNPHGLDETGPECDNFINNWVTPGMRVNRPSKNYRSVQVWAWGEDGMLKDSCDEYL